MKLTLAILLLSVCLFAAADPTVIPPTGTTKAPPETCLPDAAGGTGGPLKHATRQDKAMVFAWTCPGSPPVAFGVEPGWSGKVPVGKVALAAELNRLRVLAAYSKTPAYLQAEAQSLLIKP